MHTNPLKQFLFNVVLFFVFQIDRTLRLPHRRALQLQVQDKVHLAHWGLVSPSFDYYAEAEQSQKNGEFIDIYLDSEKASG